MIGFVPAGYIVVIADVVHLYVLKKKKALVLLFAILRYASMDSNPHREESTVIKRLKAWRYYWKTSIGPTKKPHKEDFLLITEASKPHCVHYIAYVLVIIH